jgi:MFS family permease
MTDTDLRTQQPPEPVELPGRRNRLALAGAGTIVLGAIAKFASGPGQSFFLAAFVDHLIRDAGVTRSGFAALYALATVASSVMALRVGHLVDRKGVGRVWLGVAAGLAAACLGLSVATGPIVVLAALCLMRGFGQGSFPLLGTVLVATRFDARRGRALSLSAQGITLSGVLLPVLAATLISAFGWRHALQVVALGIVVLILPLGLAAGRRPAAASTAGLAPPDGLRQTLRRPGVVRLLWILGVPPLVSTAIVVNAVSLLGQAGMHPATAAAALGLTALAGAVGAFVAGHLADGFSPRVLLTTLGAALTLSVSLMLFAAPATSLIALAVLGLSSGMSGTANGAVWASVYGTDGLGRLQGTASAGQIAGAAAGPLPLVALLGLTGSYEPGLVLLLALAVSATLSGWRWRPPSVSATRRSAPRLEPRAVEQPA